MSGFLYPRLVSISRPDADPISSHGSVGGYSGVTEATETSVLTGVKAHIELDRQGTTPVSKLPADAAGQAIWKIILKLPLGTVQTSDIITDELGDRYEVIAADWGPLVTTCRCQIQQT